MTTLLTERLIQKLRRAPRDVDVRDTRCRGLVLRCRASGRHAFRFHARRGRWIAIGPLDAVTLTDARLQADGLRGDIAHGKDPATEKRMQHAASLQLFIEKEYGPWVMAHRKTGAETLERLETVFKDFLAVPIGDLNLARVERWRIARLTAGREPATVNRDIAALRSVLSRAVEFGVLPAHPLAKLKAVRVDQQGVVRYLTVDEEKRLREAMAARDEQRRVARAQANAWRRERGYAELGAVGTYSDHLAPLVLLALNTGLRRGELLSLTWADVDLKGGLLTVRGGTTKAGETRHVPLNAEARKVVKAWRGGNDDRQCPVFAGADGEPLEGTKTSWGKLVKAANLDAFRFHDLRHTFASKLVMAGVDLNTVRELLGHGDLKMTLRYAHLAPEHKAAAVAKLVPA
jgi:integrase